MRWSILLLILAGCAPTVAPTEPDDCGAAGLAWLVGEPESLLAAMTFEDRTRFIGPGDAVTMDYSATRLNIVIDEAGRITRVFCG